jgi:hypothetical protein
MQSIIAPLQPGDRPAIANIQDALQLFLDRRVIFIDSTPLREELTNGLREERALQVYKSATQRLVTIFQQSHRMLPPEPPLEPTGTINVRTAEAMNSILRQFGLLDRPQVDTFQVAGKVSSPNSTAVGALFVQIVDKTIGEDILLANVRTRSDGSYSLTLENTWLQRGKTKPDLQAQVRTAVPNSNPQELLLLASSEVRYNASSSETALNIVLPATATTSLSSEHTTLLQELTTHFQGNLRDLKEDDNQQDITYLANKSGWDARAVAIASLADQFSVASEIDPAFFYTLFRAGLPANEEAIYQINPKTAESVWKQGIKQGLIPATLEAQLPQTLDRFKTLAVQRTLAAPAVAGVSSLKEMLDTSRITDATQQEQFVRLYTENQDNFTAVLGSRAA